MQSVAHELGVAEFRPFVLVLADVHFRSFAMSESVCKFVLARGSALDLDCQVDARGCTQSERSCDLLEV